jgi:hypothetical protein
VSSYTPPPDVAYTVAFDGEGRRTVTSQLAGVEGINIVEHSFPDALVHPYFRAGINVDVPLYSGRAVVRTAEGDHAVQAAIRLRWRPACQIFLEGHAGGDEKVGSFWNSPPASESSLFVPISSVDLLHDWRPTGPIEIAQETSDVWFSISERLGAQDHGDGAGLDSVRFLVPNGWHAPVGAKGIADPNFLPRYWYGRIEAAGGDWNLILDEVRENSGKKARDELLAVRGVALTQVGTAPGGW